MDKYEEALNKLSQSPDYDAMDILNEAITKARKYDEMMEGKVYSDMSKWNLGSKNNDK